METVFTADVQTAFACYPTPEQTDAWAESLLLRSQKEQVTGRFLPYSPITESFGNGPNTLENRYVEWTLDNGRRFYGYFQPAMKQPAPLLIHLPGYGSCMTFHPQISDDGYNILHISPLGYVTPWDTRRGLQGEDGSWPVLENTALGREGGYDRWLTDCLLGIRWAQSLPCCLPDRTSLFGTSQGGGGALLLGSLLGEAVRCICADVPFLTAFPLSGLQGEAYGLLRPAYTQVPHGLFWNRLGYVDTLSHTHRLRAPVMLTAGGRDTVCPAPTVALLYSRLGDISKQYTFLQDNVHTHSRQSMTLIRSWLSLYA